MSNIAKINFIGFFKGLYFYIPIITLYFLGHGVGLEEVVFSQVFYSISSFVGEIPTGIFADRFGQRKSIILGYTIQIFGVVLMLIFPNTFGLYITNIFNGLGASFQSGSEEALLYESTENKKFYQKHFSTYSSNEIIGYGIATLIAGIIVQFYGESSYIFLIAFTMLSLTFALITALSLKEVKTEMIELHKSSNILYFFSQSLNLIKSNKTIFALTLISILTLNGEYFLLSVYQPYFEYTHVEPFFLGTSLTIGAILNFILVKYSYLLERFLSLEKILFFINGLTGLFFILMGIIINPIFLVIVFILIQGIFNTQSPIVSDYINEQTASNIRSTLLSAMSFSRTFFQIFARIILGILVGVIGIGNSFLIQGVYLIIGICIGYWILVKCGCTYRINRHIDI